VLNWTKNIIAAWGCNVFQLMSVYSCWCRFVSDAICGLPGCKQGTNVSHQKPLSRVR